MSLARKLFTAMLLISFVYLVWIVVRNDRQTTPISVTFIGWTNNPASMGDPDRLDLAQGASGRCALFWVTNTSAPDHSIWFDSWQAEQKVEGQWALVPTNSQWRGVGGSQWMGGDGFRQAVGWPPGLATNATWRLQVRSGKDISRLQGRINMKLGRHLFHRSEKYVTFPGPEVVP
jgi:hypothetical protein